MSINILSRKIMITSRNIMLPCEPIVNCSGCMAGEAFIVFYLDWKLARCQKSKFDVFLCSHIVTSGISHIVQALHDDVFPLLACRHILYITYGARPSRRCVSFVRMMSPCVYHMYCSSTPSRRCVSFVRISPCVYHMYCSSTPSRHCVSFVGMSSIVYITSSSGP